MIHVIAKLEIAPGKRDQFLKLFHELVPQVLAEEGCIEYGPTVDCETPLDWPEPLGENIVTVMEEWESVAALQAHLVAPHMNAFREKAKEIMVGITGHVLKPV